MADKDYQRIVSDLIANAIGSSRVAGENSRITRLVAGSIDRFAAELRVGARNDEAHALVAHAAALLVESAGAEVAPALTAAVAAMTTRHRPPVTDHPIPSARLNPGVIPCKKKSAIPTGTDKP